MMKNRFKGTFEKNIITGTIEPMPPITGTIEKNLNTGTIEPRQPIKDDAIFICHSIESTSGTSCLDERSVHITFQEIDGYNFYSLRLRMSTIKKNKSLFEKITSEKVSFKEIKSIEQ